jgi:hypothetical protein
VGREGVLAPAVARDRAAEFARLELVGALEHQMLEIVRDARLAARLVGRADVVPDHVGDDRRAHIGDDHDLEPVGEPERGRAEHLGVGRRRREPGKHGPQHDNGEQAAASHGGLAEKLVRGLAAWDCGRDRQAP